MRSLSLPWGSRPHLGGVVEAAPVSRPFRPLAVPDVAEADDVDGLVLVLEVVEDPDVLLGAAAGPEDGDVDPLVGALDAADGGMGKRTGGHDRAGRDPRRFQEIATAHHGFFLHR